MMRRIIYTVSYTVFLLLISMASTADVNTSLGGSMHSHTSTSSGKITSIAVQEQGIEFGTKEDRLDAEVIVTLDSMPGYLFGVRLHDGAQPATSTMIDLLKQAYFQNLPVSLFHVQPPGKKNVNVLRVEMKHQ